MPRRPPCVMDCRARVISMWAPRPGDRDIPARIPLLYMNLRVLEVLAGAGSLVLFIALLVVLPGFMVESEGAAYILALIIFIAALSVAGYSIDKMVA